MSVMAYLKHMSKFDVSKVFYAIKKFWSMIILMMKKKWMNPNLKIYNINSSWKEDPMEVKLMSVEISSDNLIVYWIFANNSEDQDVNLLMDILNNVAVYNERGDRLRVKRFGCSYDDNCQGRFDLLTPGKYLWYYQIIPFNRSLERCQTISITSVAFTNLQPETWRIPILCQ